VPQGYAPAQRGVPGGFVGDPDVMDTWATSSLSPQIVCGWPDDADLFARTFPMDLRRRRTTSFAHGCSPRCCARTSSTTRCRGGTRRSPASSPIPTGRRFEVEGENVVTPLALLEEHGSETPSATGGKREDRERHAVRRRNQMQIGRAAGDQILNASKFALSGTRMAQRRSRGRSTRRSSRDDRRPRVGGRLDTRDLENYEYARVLQRTETFSGASATTTSSS